MSGGSLEKLFLKLRHSSRKLSKFLACFFLNEAVQEFNSHKVASLRPATWLIGALLLGQFSGLLIKFCRQLFHRTASDGCYLKKQVCFFLFPNYGTLNRSSRPEMFCEKDVKENFSKFTGKHLCQNPFLNKDAELRPVSLLKKRLWYRCFPMNFAKFLTTPFL